MRTSIIVFLFVPLTFAQDYQQFCFSTPRQVKRVQKEITFLVLPSDKIKVHKNCLDVVSSSQRLKLFNKYIYQNYRQDLITQNITPPKECHLNIYQDTLPQENQTQVAITSEQLKANTQEQTGRVSSKTQLILTHEKPGRFQYQEAGYTITCSPQGDGYQVDITSQSPRLGFKTQRHIKKGERVELGQLHKKSQERRDSAALTDQAATLNHQTKDASSKTIVSIEVVK